MSIEKTDAIARFFVYLGGDPERAVKEAKAFNNVNDWVNRQKNRVSWMGATAMLIPFFHIPAMIVDALYLFRKMTYVCWGVAAIHGCKPSGTADFKIILAHWSGAIGDEMLDDAIEDSTNEFDESALLSSIADQVFKLLISTYAKRGAQGVLLPTGIKAGGKKAAVVVNKAAAKAGIKAGTKVGAKAGAKVAAKLSLKYLAKIGAKFAAKILTGFLPLIGVVVTVSLNRYFVNSIAKSADRYYSTLQKYLTQHSQKTLNPADKM